MSSTTTLLNYLTRPNVELDQSQLKTGPNTLDVGSYNIEGIQSWRDFTRKKIIECFGDILQADTAAELLYQPPPIPEHFCKLTNKSCVDAILLKHNHVRVNCALTVAPTQLKNRGLQLPISWSWGSLSHVEEDTQLCPDWAGILHLPNPPYMNRVLSDTKQSRKWTSTMRNLDVRSYQEEFFKSLRQVLLYCIKVNSRYEYIITDAEEFFFCRTKFEEPARSLSINRPHYQHTQLMHNWVASITSVTSGTFTMLLDSSSSPYTNAGNPDINKGSLEYTVVS